MLKADVIVKNVKYKISEMISRQFIKMDLLVKLELTDLRTAFSFYCFIDFE